MKKSLVMTITLFLLLPCLFSQTGTKELGFFEPSYNTIDKATGELIVDLYYNHLLSLNTVNVLDLRSTPFPKNLENTSIDIALKIEVVDVNAVWTIRLYALSNGKTHTREKTYSSYYQVLLAAKQEVTSFIESLLTSKTGAGDTQGSTGASTTVASLDLDSIAGTWFTDTYIDKIILLRGGRGFVIFKNGASMNISVEINGSQIIAVQTSKSNASFFPELPRALALKVAAENLAPIEWVMTAKNENEMIGEKKHYEAVYENNEATSVKNVSSPSRWTR